MSVPFPVDFAVGNGISFRVPTCASNSVPFPLPFPSFFFTILIPCSELRDQKISDLELELKFNSFNISSRPLQLYVRAGFPRQLAREHCDQ